MELKFVLRNHEVRHKQLAAYPSHPYTQCKMHILGLKDADARVFFSSVIFYPVQGMGSAIKLAGITTSEVLRFVILRERDMTVASDMKT